MTSFPFRTTLHYPAPTDTVDGLPVHQALGALAGTSAMLDNARSLDYERQAETAPELYLWTLVRARSVAFSAAQWVTLGHHLVARALRDAQAEGVLWTPLLDQLATQSIWVDQVKPGTVPSHLPGMKDFTVTPVQPLALTPKPGLVFMQISEWAEGASLHDLERVAAAFNSHYVLHALALTARRMSPTLLARLTTAPETANALVQNAALTGEHREAVAEWLGRAYVDLSNREQTNRQPQSGSRSVLSAVETMAAGGLPSGVHAEWSRVVLDAARRGVVPSVVFIRGLLGDPSTPLETLRGTTSVLRNAEELALWAAHPSQRPTTVMAALDGRGDAVKTTVLGLTRAGAPLARPDVLEALFDLAGRQSDPYCLAGLVGLHSAPIGCLRQAAADGRSQAVRHALAENQRAMTDPEVRASLRLTRDPVVRSALLRGAPPEAFGDNLRRLAAVDPDRALALVEAIGIPAGAVITKADILPLLTHGAEVPDRTVRVMRIINAVTPEVPKRARRGR